MPDPAVANPGEELAGSVASLDDCAFGQCVNGTATVFAELGVSGFPWDRVHVRRNPFVHDSDVLPCAIVSPYMIRPNNGRGANTATAVNFLVMLSLHWAGGRESVNGMGQALAALQAAYAKFSKKSSADIGFYVDRDGACLLDAKVDNAEALNLEAWRMGLTTQFLVVDYLLRLPYPEAD